LKLRNPGIGFRLLVIGGQAGFFCFYTIAYILSPRYCHRLVAYLEEEAVYTYTKLIEQIDEGSLPLFKHMKAPAFAVKYYNLDKDCMLRDVFNCMRMDESAHRDANHHFGDLKPDEPNVMTDHLVKHHFNSFPRLREIESNSALFFHIFPNVSVTVYPHSVYTLMTMPSKTQGKTQEQLTLLMAPGARKEAVSSDEHFEKCQNLMDFVTNINDEDVEAIENLQLGLGNLDGQGVHGEFLPKYDWPVHRFQNMVLSGLHGEQLPRDLMPKLADSFERKVLGV